MREIEDSYVDFRDRLESLGLQPVLIGALAAARYRLAPRSTTDVDFLVRRLGDLVEVMERDGLAVHAMAEPGEEPYVVFIRGAGCGWTGSSPRPATSGKPSIAPSTVSSPPRDVLVHKLLAWRPRRPPRRRRTYRNVLATGQASGAGTGVAAWPGAWP